MVLTDECERVAAPVVSAVTTRVDALQLLSELKDDCHSPSGILEPDLAPIQHSKYVRTV